MNDDLTNDGTSRNFVQILLAAFVADFRSGGAIGICVFW